MGLLAIGILILLGWTGGRSVLLAVRSARAFLVRSPGLYPAAAGSVSLGIAAMFFKILIVFAALGFLCLGLMIWRGMTERGRAES